MRVWPPLRRQSRAILGCRGPWEPCLGENSLARIWHGYLIFGLSVLPAAAGRTGVFVSWLVTGSLLMVAGPTLGQRRLPRRCEHRSRVPPDPGSRTGPDLRFLVAGPGFEPGKTVAGDFTSLPGTALTWANVRVIRHLGTYWT
jgi:hypothetical protein